MSDITSIRLQDALNAIERNAHDGILTSEQVTEAYALADELGEAVGRLQDENAKLKALCEWLLEPYRLGAITGEGVDKRWCRETYDGGSYRLRELGVDT